MGWIAFGRSEGGTPGRESMKGKRWLDAGRLVPSHEGDYVVLPRSTDLNNTQIGFLPVDAVAALGVTERALPALGPSPVEHAMDVPVADHLLTEVERAFPGPIHLQNGSRWLRATQNEACSRQTIDEVVVNEQFQPGTDIQSPCGLGWLRQGRRREQQTENKQRRPHHPSSLPGLGYIGGLEGSTGPGS